VPQRTFPVSIESHDAKLCSRLRKEGAHYPDRLHERQMSGDTVPSCDFPSPAIRPNARKPGIITHRDLPEFKEAIRQNSIIERQIGRSAKASSGPDPLAAAVPDRGGRAGAVGDRLIRAVELLEPPPKLPLIEEFRIKATIWDFAAIVAHHPGSLIQQIHTRNFRISHHATRSVTGTPRDRGRG
jgi:hypothetical protein